MNQSVAMIYITDGLRIRYIPLTVNINVAKIITINNKIIFPAGHPKRMDYIIYLIKFY